MKSLKNVDVQQQQFIMEQSLSKVKQKNIISLKDLIRKPKISVGDLNNLNEQKRKKSYYYSTRQFKKLKQLMYKQFQKQKSVHDLILKLEDQCQKCKFDDFYSYYLLIYIRGISKQSAQLILLRQIQQMMKNKSAYQTINSMIQKRQQQLKKLSQKLEQYNNLAILNHVKQLQKQQKNQSVQQKIKDQIYNRIIQMRQININLIMQINKWKNALIQLRKQQKQIQQEAIIYLYKGQNYLHKMVNDNKFILLSKFDHIRFVNQNDPFLVRALNNHTKLLIQQQYKSKIAQCLLILAKQRAQQLKFKLNIRTTNNNHKQSYINHSKQSDLAKINLLIQDFDQFDHLIKTYQKQTLSKIKSKNKSYTLNTKPIPKIESKNAETSVNKKIIPVNINSQQKKVKNQQKNKKNKDLLQKSKTLAIQQQYSKIIALKNIEALSKIKSQNHSQIIQESIKQQINTASNIKNNKSSTKNVKTTSIKNYKINIITNPQNKFPIQTKKLIINADKQIINTKIFQKPFQISRKSIQDTKISDVLDKYKKHSKKQQKIQEQTLNKQTNSIKNSKKHLTEQSIKKIDLSQILPQIKKNQYTQINSSLKNLKQKIRDISQRNNNKFPKLNKQDEISRIKNNESTQQKVNKIKSRIISDVSKQLTRKQELRNGSKTLQISERSMIQNEKRKNLQKQKLDLQRELNIENEKIIKKLQQQSSLKELRLRQMYESEIQRLKNEQKKQSILLSYELQRQQLKRKQRENELIEQLQKKKKLQQQIQRRLLKQQILQQLQKTKKNRQQQLQKQRLKNEQKQRLQMQGQLLKIKQLAQKQLKQLQLQNKKKIIQINKKTQQSKKLNQAIQKQKKKLFQQRKQRQLKIQQEYRQLQLIYDQLQSHKKIKIDKYAHPLLNNQSLPKQMKLQIKLQILQQIQKKQSLLQQQQLLYQAAKQQKIQSIKQQYQQLLLSQKQSILNQNSTIQLLIQQTSTLNSKHAETYPQTINQFLPNSELNSKSNHHNILQQQINKKWNNLRPYLKITKKKYISYSNIQNYLSSFFQQQPKQFKQMMPYNNKQLLELLTKNQVDIFDNSFGWKQKEKQKYILFGDISCLQQISNIYGCIQVEIRFKFNQNNQNQKKYLTKKIKLFQSIGYLYQKKANQQGDHAIKIIIKIPKTASNILRKSNKVQIFSKVQITPNKSMLNSKFYSYLFLISKKLTNYLTLDQKIYLDKYGQNDLISKQIFKMISIFQNHPQIQTKINIQQSSNSIQLKVSVPIPICLSTSPCYKLSSKSYKQNNSFFYFSKLEKFSVAFIQLQHINLDFNIDIIIKLLKKQGNIKQTLLWVPMWKSSRKGLVNNYGIKPFTYQSELFPQYYIGSIIQQPKGESKTLRCPFIFVVFWDELQSLEEMRPIYGQVVSEQDLISNQ